MGVSVDTEEIDNLVDKLTNLLVRNKQDNTTNRRTGTGPRTRPRMRNSRKVRCFARCQNMFADCPRELARLVEDNELDKLAEDDRRRPDFSSEEIKGVYNPLWEAKGDYEWSVPPIAPSIPPEDVWTPISPEEVMKRIMGIPRSSAGGPDGIQKCDLLGIPGIQGTLAKLFMMLLVVGHFPCPWRINRTVLIPKAGKDPTLIGNNRPITIGSLIARVFSGLICARLASNISFSPRQKGFMSVNGTFENCFLLDEATRAAISNRKDLVVLMVDIRRAFDTVPHAAISGALEGAGLHRDVSSRVLSMYQRVNTRFKSSQGEVVIDMQRGVKQGDPSSPLLFNTVMDPLIRWLDRESAEGFGPLAYADDLIVLSRSPEEAQLLLAGIGAYLSAIGMELSVEKCLAYWLKRTPSGAMRVLDPEISYDGKNITLASTKEGYRYLGVQFSPLKGLSNADIMNKIRECSRRVDRLPMKPRQKLRLFYEFVLPRCFYRMAIDPPSKTKLKGLDRELRTWVKGVLHLPPSTPKGLIHVKVKNGGLGLPRMASACWLSHFRAARAVLESDDRMMLFYCRENGVLGRVRRAAEAWGIPWPMDGPDLSLAKTQLYQKVEDDWAALESTGHGVPSFLDDPVGNRWLRDPILMKESNFLIALRLRGNLLGTRSALRRVDQSIPPECRQCGAEVESLCHVLGVCPHNHSKIIRRHDEIKEFVATKLEEAGWLTMVEPEFEVTRGGTTSRLRPDIVVIKDGDVRVVDIAITYEDGNSLDRVAMEKKNKYFGLKDVLLERFGGQSFAILPIVIGARGALPKCTRKCMNRLGLAVASDGLTMSLIALRSSIGIATRHMDR